MSGRRTLIVWGLVGLVAVLFAGALALDLAGGETRDSAAELLLTIAVIVSNLAVGAVLALRRPENSIGWILIANAVFVTLNGFASAYADYAFNGGHPDLPLASWAVVFVDRNWPANFYAVTAIAYVFPDGSVPPERRRMAKFTAASFVLLLIAAVFSATEFVEPFEAVANPVPQLPDALATGLVTAGMIGALIGMIWVAFALRARLRAVTGEERLQLRWLSFAAATIPAVIVVCVIEGVLTGKTEWATLISLAIALTAIPVAIGIAVMRYRLYEIDRVINRSLVYFALSVVLVVAFAAVSIGVGVVVGGGSTVPTAAATLVVVLAFNPLRGRIQRQVDRRFNRARYEGLRRVETFLDDLRAGTAAPEAVERTLAEALDDPELELLYWISPDSPYVDTGGVPRSLDLAPGRVPTPVTRGPLRLGTVVHDQRVAEQPDLLASVVEAAGLAIEIGRLRGGPPAPGGGGGIAGRGSSRRRSRSGGAWSVISTTVPSSASSRSGSTYGTSRARSAPTSARPGMPSMASSTSSAPRSASFGSSRAACARRRSTTVSPRRWSSSARGHRCPPSWRRRRSASTPISKRPPFSSPARR
ncbi:MAG: hypothetical protein U0R24_04460 [Solirubrobacterales bacterium]